MCACTLCKCVHACVKVCVGVCVNRKKQGVNDLTVLIRQQLDGDVLLYTFHVVRPGHGEEGEPTGNIGGGERNNTPNKWI